MDIADESIIADRIIEVTEIQTALEETTISDLPVECITHKWEVDILPQEEGRVYNFFEYREAGDHGIKLDERAGWTVWVADREASTGSQVRSIRQRDCYFHIQWFAVAVQC